MFVAHQCNFGAYDSGNRDGTCAFLELESGEKEK